MVAKSAKQMQSNGYRLNVGENSEYLVFESEEDCKKLYLLERVFFDLINFCKMNENSQDEIYVSMSASEKFLENFPIIKIKVGGDNVNDGNVEGAFEIAFPTINNFFHTIHFSHHSDFDFFYNSLKSHEVKNKYRDLFAAVGDVLYLEKK